MLQRIASSLLYRSKWARLGVMYARRPDVSRIKIAGRNVCLSFPPKEQSRQEHELHKILLDDCYRLRSIQSAGTILDVGSNIGLFAVAARNRFNRAAIHCYEPNSAVFPNLQSHADQIGATCFQEAIGLKDGRISLETSADGSLFSVSRSDPAGAVRQRSFAHAIRKLGSVDLLKLDCEGAEWDLFTDREPWKAVRHLVMEYHLWAKPGSTVSELTETLKVLGFHNIQVQVDSPDFGMAFAEK